MTGFVDVLLRGLILSSQAVAIGGVAFALVLLRPLTRAPGAPRALLAPTLGWTTAAAVVLAAGQVLGVLVQLWALDGQPDASRRLLDTTYVRGCLAKLLACGGIVVAAVGVGRRPRAEAWWAALTGAALALALASAWTSHAAARPGHRATLLALDFAHQLAASVWIGGLVHLLLAARRRGGAPAGLSLSRFSTMAMTAVAVLVGAGLGLTVAYVGSLSALLGTAYGMMVLSKVAVGFALVLLGAANFLAIRRARSAALDRTRLGRNVEVEVGLGLSLFFVAASLTSLPPAADLTAGRATFAEVVQRFTPQWPRLTSPGIDAMPAENRDGPRTDAERGWSEYNHHVSGFLVLAMGLLAVAAGTGHARWARNWPLLFLGLAAFIAVRADAEAWPLGALAFWDSMAYPEILQHRLFALIVVAFGVFEWRVRTGRITGPGAARVFPLLCAVGGGLLLTHAHGGVTVKEEFLIEVTHIPLGLLAMAVGWGRWLELRSSPPLARRAGRVWEVGLVLVGLLLVLYRET